MRRRRGNQGGAGGHHACACDPVELTHGFNSTYSTREVSRFSIRGCGLVDNHGATEGAVADHGTPTTCASCAMSQIRAAEIVKDVRTTELGGSLFRCRPMTQGVAKGSRRALALNYSPSKRPTSMRLDTPRSLTLPTNRRPPPDRTLFPSPGGACRKSCRMLPRHEFPRTKTSRSHGLRKAFGPHPNPLPRGEGTFATPL